MKIFVGYGYNDRDKWIEDLVFPLIEAFDDTPVAGKEIFGNKLVSCNINSLNKDFQTIDG